MKDQYKTKKTLLQKLDAQKMRIAELEQLESEHKRNDETLKLITDNMSDMIRLTNLQGINLYTSPSHEKVLGYKPEERVGKSAFDIVHPDDVGHIINVFSDGLINKKPVKVEYRTKHAKGHYIWLETIGDLLRDDQGEVMAVIQSSRNITDRKRAEEVLKESENKYRLLADNVNDIIFVFDMNLNYTYISPSIKTIRGYEPEEILEKASFDSLLTPSSRDLAVRTLSEVMELEKSEHRDINMSRTLQLELRRKDGTIVWTEVKLSFIRDENQQPIGILGVSRDITERKRVEEELKQSEGRYRELSIIDDLTQLYNSRHFYQQLKMEIDRVDRYGQPLTLLLLDLDDFKQFNDTYGHIEGDGVLSRLGQVIKRCLRQTDSAYRYGGEEFTILLPMTTSKDAAVTAERIRAEFKEENFSPAPCKDVHLTMSIGLGQYQPQEDMKTFVHRVDQLMYQGKKNGKDRVCSES
jgi:diguanylate cyclase (GGDEF)-like protein/PAS domain S-box-containing protein